MLGSIQAQPAGEARTQAFAPKPVVSMLAGRLFLESVLG